MTFTQKTSFYCSRNQQNSLAKNPLLVLNAQIPALGIRTKHAITGNCNSRTILSVAFHPIK